LTLTPTFTPVTGNTFTIINNDGSDAVSGTFKGLAEGASVTISGVSYTISYQGGTGNDVVLTANNTTVSTTTTVATSASPSVFGQSVTFTATVVQGSGSTIPTGNVTFTNGATTLENSDPGQRGQGYAFHQHPCRGRAYTPSRPLTPGPEHLPAVRALSARR